MAATTKPTTTRPPRDILDAMTSPTWWGPWFTDGDWSAWRAFLAAAFGLPLPEHAGEVLRSCTGLQAAPEARAREVYAIVGRRGGKTKILSLCAAYLAAFVDWRPYLSRGERANVLLVAKDRVQAGIAFQFILSFFLDHPRLKALVDGEPHQDAIVLRNQVTIRVASASFRGLRGFAIAALLADELAYWFEGDTAANPAQEVLLAVRPAMLQFQGKAMLLAGSSPFKRSGPLWEAYRDHFGKPGSTLVWLAPTEVMHPLGETERAQIAKERDRDPEGAAAEYDCVWRDDVAGFLDADLIEQCTDAGVTARLPKPGVTYGMTIDPSGGRGDPFAAAVGHVEEGRIVIDALYHRAPPFAPAEAIREVGELASRYRVTRVRTDRYAEPLVQDALARVGLQMDISERSTSDLYLGSLRHLANGTVRLLDDRRLAQQLGSLQRRTGASGKDSVVHPRFQHDDLAACVASLIVLLATDARGTLLPIARMAEASAPDLPAVCDFVYAVALVAGDGTLGVVYFAIVDRTDREHRRAAIVLDFDAVPMASGRFVEVYRRAAELSKACGAAVARHVGIYTSVEHRAYAEREIGALPAFLVGCAVASIFPAMLRELPRMAHLASGPVQGGSVKLSADVVRKMREAPLGGQLGFRSGDEVEWPLGVAGIIGIVLAFEDERTLRKAV
jgi:hypothetical protein